MEEANTTVRYFVAVKDQHNLAIAIQSADKYRAGLHVDRSCPTEHTARTANIRHRTWSRKHGDLNQFHTYTTQPSSTQHKQATTRRRGAHCFIHPPPPTPIRIVGRRRWPLPSRPHHRGSYAHTRAHIRLQFCENQRQIN